MIKEIDSTRCTEDTIIKIKILVLKNLDIILILCCCESKNGINDVFSSF